MKLVHENREFKLVPTTWDQEQELLTYVGEKIDVVVKPNVYSTGLRGGLEHQRPLEKKVVLSDLSLKIDDV